MADSTIGTAGRAGGIGPGAPGQAAPGPGGPGGPGDSGPGLPGPGHGLLAGKTVLVTAAAGTGIGFATAQRCAAEGATVAISDRHERRLGEAAERLADETGNKPLAIPCDGTVQAQVDHLIDTVVAELGHVDVLV